MKKITIIIPNLNGMAYLKGCLSSLRNQTYKDFETIMIDNGSGDGSVDYVRSHFPEVRIRAFKENTGFCRAVNTGIRMSSGSKYVILLNNDTVCAGDMVEELKKAMDADRRRFSCAAKMISLRDPSVLDDAGDYYCALGWAFARGKGKPSAGYGRAERIFACCAAAAIYRMSSLNQVGLFDERHFAYLEDIDIGYRAQLCGLENWYIPAAKVFHAGSATSGSRYNAFKVKLASRNSVYLIRKNMPLWQIALNSPLLLAGFSVKTVFFWKKGFGREYVLGLLKGLSMGRGEMGRNAMAAGKASPARCWMIQIQLWKNCLVRLTA